MQHEKKKIKRTDTQPGSSHGRTGGKVVLGKRKGMSDVGNADYEAVIKKQKMVENRKICCACVLLTTSSRHSFLFLLTIGT